MQHECCLVCNVFQSVGNMVSATVEPQRISVVTELPLLWWGLLDTLSTGLSYFQSLLTELHYCLKDQTDTSEIARNEQSLKDLLIYKVRRCNVLESCIQQV